MTSDLLFERGRPGDELEAEAVVDHGEPPGGEREALAIGAGDIFPTTDMIEWQTGFGDELLAQRTDLAISQRVEQPAGEDHAAALPLGEALADQVFSPLLERLLHLGAKAALRQRDGLAGNRLPVEPGRARCVDLRVDVQVGTDGERDAALTLCILVGAQLDDRSGWAVASGIEMLGEEMAEPIAGEFRMVADEVNFGVSLQQALTNLSERVPLTDLRYFVVSVLIQRDSGGNLTEVLGNLSRLIRERLKLLARVRVLSSEGRLSAWILGLMPFALAALMNVFNPEFMSPLWTDPIGQTVIKYMLVVMLVGVVLLRKIVKIRV